jgi:hypothetical protein
MATLLLGIPAVTVFLDDTLVATADVETHKKGVQEVFSRLQEAGLCLNFRKCSFFQKEIEYLGYKISKQGISPLKGKIEAVTEAPQPRNIPELRSFLGSINYYGRFIDGLAHKLQPLFACLEKEKFHWSEKCTEVFKKIKKELTSDSVLVHFDPKKPIVVTCDASPYGISAVPRTEWEMASTTQFVLPVGRSQPQKSGIRREGSARNYIWSKKIL